MRVFLFDLIDSRIHIIVIFYFIVVIVEVYTPGHIGRLRHDHLIVRIHAREIEVIEQVLLWLRPGRMQEVYWSNWHILLQRIRRFIKEYFIRIRVCRIFDSVSMFLLHKGYNEKDFLPSDDLIFGELKMSIGQLRLLLIFFQE